MTDKWQRCILTIPLRSPVGTARDRSMSRLRDSALRFLAGVMVAGAAVATGVPTAAQAADSEWDWWLDTYGVQAAHDAGLTGAGVKIAVIDESINPNLPVFQGRSLTVSDSVICPDRTPAATDVADAGAIHGSTVTAMIIGNGAGAGGLRGIAPEADVTFYGYGTGSDDCRPDTDLEITDFGYAVKTAVDDGADIITTSITMGARSADGPAVAYALSRGVAIIAGTPNPDMLAVYDKDLGAMNGIVAASAIGREGDLQTSENGEVLALAQTTVVAAGKNLPSVGRADDWDASAPSSGSSFAAPVVAGMLALAAQKTPAASGTQLVQALVRTTNGQVHDLTRSDDGYGYGAAWLPTLLSVDPTTFPDETPLVDKAAGIPTPDQISEATTAGGYVPIVKADSFQQYGDDDAPSGPDLGGLVIWLVAGAAGILVVAILIVVAIVIAQRRKAGKGITP